MLALISVRPPPSGYCAHHRRSPRQGHAWCGACSPTLTMLGPVPLILLSRFANLETFTVPPLTFGHTTPAIAYTSGMFSLPSAARVGPFGRRGSVFGSQGSAGGCASDSLKIAHRVHPVKRFSRCSDWHTVSWCAPRRRNRTRAHALARHPPTCQDFTKCNLVGTHPAGGIENT
jgi:hypothetical protein